MRLAVTGGRDHHPSATELKAFWSLFDDLGGTELHHGGCRGVDQAVARSAAESRPALKVVEHLADWKTHGKQAGPLRNAFMLAQVEGLLVFPGGAGTENCERQARQRGIPIYRPTAEDLVQAAGDSTDWSDVDDPPRRGSADTRFYAQLSDAEGTVVGRGRSFGEATINAILNFHARRLAWPSAAVVLGTLAEVPGGEKEGQEAVRKSWERPR